MSQLSLQLKQEAIIIISYGKFLMFLQHGNRSPPSSVTSNHHPPSSHISLEGLPKSLRSNEDPNTLRYDLHLHRQPPPFGSSEEESPVLLISDHGEESLARMDNDDHGRSLETSEVKDQSKRVMASSSIPAPTQSAPTPMVPAHSALAPTQAPATSTATAEQMSEEAYYPGPEDYAKPLRPDDPKASLGSQHRQQQRLQHQQQHFGVNSPTTPLSNQPSDGRHVRQGGGGGQRSLAKPPPYEAVVRQAQDQGHQDVPMGQIQSPGSPDHTVIIGKFVAQYFHPLPFFIFIIIIFIL